MKLKEIYSYCIEELKEKEEKYIDTELLMCYVLQKDRLFVKLNLDHDIDKEQENIIKKYVQELKNDKPIHYITHTRDFYGCDYIVDEHVLIPRGDTEILVDECIKILKKQNKKLRGLEIGVGSGIISICLLKNIAKLEMVAVDINDYAIEISKKNAQNLGVSDRLNVMKSDLFENLDGEKFDFIISNPPYIDEDDMKKLPKKVKNYEPKTALYGKENGLYFYDEIIKNGKKFLNENYFIFFEIGYNQGKKLCDLFTKYSYKNEVKIIKDYEKNDRVVCYENK